MQGAFRSEKVPQIEREVGDPAPPEVEIDGRTYVLEHPIKGDLALVKAHVADRMGNLVYRKTARNFGPVMAAAAAITIVQVDSLVEPGGLDPEVVVTPGIYVDHVVVCPSVPELARQGAAG